MKNFLAKKSIGFYFTAATVLLCLTACVLYGVSRENSQVAVILLLAFAAVAGIAVIVKPFKFTEYAPFVLTAIPTAILLVMLLNNVADIFAKNNVIGLSSTFVASLVFAVLALALSAVAITVKQEKDI